jgi:hypothetical protein
VASSSRRPSPTEQQNDSGEQQVAITDIGVEQQVTIIDSGLSKVV